MVVPHPSEELRGFRDRPDVCSDQRQVVDCARRVRDQENRADERPVNEILYPAINGYITTFRPMLETRGSSPALSGFPPTTECG